MKDKTDRRKELLSGESKLETFAAQLYVERFSKSQSHWWWESKVEWGSPEEQC
jgi:hypothetical protein